MKIGLNLRKMSNSFVRRVKRTSGRRRRGRNGAGGVCRHPAVANDGPDRDGFVLTGVVFSATDPECGLQRDSPSRSNDRSVRRSLRQRRYGGHHCAAEPGCIESYSHNRHYQRKRHHNLRSLQPAKRSYLQGGREFRNNGEGDGALSRLRDREVCIHLASNFEFQPVERLDVTTCERSCRMRRGISSVRPSAVAAMNGFRSPGLVVSGDQTRRRER